jgi:hypothetical protein
VEEVGKTVSVDRTLRFDQLPDDEIRRLVRSLNSLQEGELGIAMLVACGPRAVPFLREFLLLGRPAGVAEPRQRAVRALTELGAKDVLLEYLRAPRAIADPVIRMGEDAVVNTAARALRRWPDDDEVVRELIYLAGHAVPGAIETLAPMRRVEAIPYFVEALGDNFARHAANDALRALGSIASAALVHAARTLRPSTSFEEPASLQRRREAMRILADLDFEQELWADVYGLLLDSDFEVAATAARLALQRGGTGDRDVAARRLFQALEMGDWLVRAEVEDCLKQNHELLSEQIDAEIARRSDSAITPQHADHVLIALRRIRHTAASSRQGPV